MSFAVGKWKLAGSENFDAYMKEIGVGLVTRKMGATLTPVQDITVNGDHWTIKTSTTFRSSELDFRLGETFEENTPDGRKVQTICTLEGQKLIQSQKGGVDTVLTREFSEKEMNMVLTANDVTCTRKYVRVEQ